MALSSQDHCLLLCKSVNVSLELQRPCSRPQVGAFFTSIPQCVLGGMTTFLFAGVCVSGIKVCPVTSSSYLTALFVPILVCSRDYHSCVHWMLHFKQYGRACSYSSIKFVDWMLSVKVKPLNKALLSTSSACVLLPLLKLLHHCPAEQAHPACYLHLLPYITITLIHDKDL